MQSQTPQPEPQHDWRRYERQILIPEIGEQGQRALREASVFLTGLGGLGSISAAYLVAAGIGRLRAVDRDRVEVHNLNRQLLHWTCDEGRVKASSAEEKLKALNPDVSLDLIEATLDDGNAADLIGDCQVIVDGTDNLATRKVLNRIAVSKGIPYVFAGVESFRGMITTFAPPATPCLECVVPADEERKGTLPILGAVPGIAASIQALETLKIILGLGSSLIGRMLVFDGKSMSFKTLPLEADPRCVVCGAGGESESESGPGGAGGGCASGNDKAS